MNRNHGFKSFRLWPARTVIRSERPGRNRGRVQSQTLAWLATAGLLFFSFAAITSTFAQDLTPEEKARLIVEYEKLKQTTGGAPPDAAKLLETQTYQTPDIYSSIPEPKPDAVKPNAGDKGSIFPEGKMPVPKPAATSSEELKLFGYDIFTAQPSSFAPVEDIAPPVDYTLGPGDNLIVNLWGRVDLELNLTCDREGKVFIPKAGEVIAWGLTVPEFEKRLRSKLSTVYSNFRLTVILGKLRTIKVYVFGEVKRPGGYAVTSLASLFNALYLAGGPNERGSLRQIRLVRQNQLVATVDFYEFLLKGFNRDDLKLLSGDVIYVPVVGPLVKIRGQVKRPAIYELKDAERLTAVIALAGGTLPNAYLERVMIDRIDAGDRRQLIDLNLRDSTVLAENNLTIHDGDDISVFSKYELRENMVWLTGQVKHPGTFERTAGMTIRDLLKGGEFLEYEAYRHRADLYRLTHNRVRAIIPVNLDLALAGDSTMNFVLQDRDSLRIYSRQEVEHPKFVFISGEVRQPGKYDLLDSMRLWDLIFLSGNLDKSAYLLRAEVARMNPGKPADVLFVNLADVQADPESPQNLFLKEDDQVFIREIPQYRLQENVKITGEVQFPGEYTLQKENETLYALLKRAGFFTERAFAKGTIITRQEVVAEIRRQNLPDIVANTQRLVKNDSTGQIERPNLDAFDPAKATRIVVDLEEILRTEGKKGDIVLRRGDQIHVPDLPAGIPVMGAVAANGTINFARGKKLGYYVERAGGFTPNADKKEVRLVKANGRVYSGGKARGQKVELGDAVVVTTRVQEKKDWLKIFASTASILSGVATTAFVIDRLR